MVNFLESWEIRKDGIKYFSWITDLPLNPKTVFPIMRGGRARWKIENETYYTLKNQGYHFDHNFGHGEKHLSVVLALLMMVAFLVDQTQQLCDELFRRVWDKLGSKRMLWEQMREVFHAFVLGSMQELLRVLLQGYQKQRPVLQEDTS